LLMVKVRLLEVSLYARGPRKGDVCRDVAFHKEMPKILSRYTWNNTPHPCVHEPWSRKSRQTKWINTLHSWRKNKPAEKNKKRNFHFQVDLKAILMEQCDEDVG
jgi:hypothetical protein